MTYQQQIELELLKTGLSLFVAVVTLLVGLLIGNRLSSRITMLWAIRQKRREIELDTANRFYQVYGEFFAVWKLWSYHKEQQFPDGSRWALLQRAATAEGGLEAIFVKLSSEKRLGPRDIEILGRFRQGYQSLREAIRDDRYLGWATDKHPEYMSFKQLAGLISDIILADIPSRKGVASYPDEALMQITQNVWKQREWVLNDEDWQRLKER